MWTNFLIKASFVMLVCGLGISAGAGHCQTPNCGTNAWIRQTIVLRDLRDRLPRDFKGHLYLDIYPAKRTADPAKRDFELVMYVRGDDNREIGVNAVHDETIFRREAANYFNYLLRHRVRPADIPQSYFLELDLHAMEKFRSFVIALPPLPGPICTPMVYLRGNDLRLDSVPVCKCPPGPCTGCPKGIQPKDHERREPQSKYDVYSSQLDGYADKYKALRN